MNEKTDILKYFERQLRVSLFIDKAKNYGPEILIPVHESGEVFDSDNEGNLCPSFKELLAGIINPNSFFYDVFWNSYADCKMQNSNVDNDFELNDVIEILKALELREKERKTKEAKLSEKFSRFVKTNAILSKITHQTIGLPFQSRQPGLGHKYQIVLDEETKQNIIKKNYEIVLHSFLAINGLSPLRGQGDLEIYDDSNIPTSVQKEFLMSKKLIQETDELQQEYYDKYKTFGDDQKEGMSNPNETTQDGFHLGQLEYLLAELNKFIKELESYKYNHNLESMLPTYGLNSILRDWFYTIPLNEKGIKRESFLLNLQKLNKRMTGETTYKDLYEKNESDLLEQLHCLDINLSAYVDNAYADVFIKALRYLRDFLEARRQMCLEFDVSPKDLAILSGLSSEKTITNELTRKSSPLTKRKVLPMPIKEIPPNYFGRDKFRNITSKSAFEWIKDKKRKENWKEITYSDDLNYSLSIQDIENNVDFFNKLFDQVPKLPAHLKKVMQKEISKDSPTTLVRAFSQAERTIILKALKLNETLGDSKSIKLKKYFLAVFETDIVKYVNKKN
tara:strand:- start:767 stop:2455 length:1689 start_codon:yes stop_codon:yes gene_type:complete